MDRLSFRAAYRAARWVLRTRTPADLPVVLPDDSVRSRHAIASALAFTGRLRTAAGQGPWSLLGDPLAAKAAYLADPPGGLIDLDLLRLFGATQVRDPQRLP